MKRKAGVFDFAIDKWDSSLRKTVPVGQGCAIERVERGNGKACAQGLYSPDVCLACRQVVYGARWVQPFKKNSKPTKAECKGVAKREEEEAGGSNVSPDTATFSGHQFDLRDMPSELKLEIIGAVFNRTRFEDLAAPLLRFKVDSE